MPRRYRDGLGFEYIVPDRALDAFEKKRRRYLLVSIMVQAVIIGGYLFAVRWW